MDRAASSAGRGPRALPPLPSTRGPWDGDPASRGGGRRRWAAPAASRAGAGRGRWRWLRGRRAVGEPTDRRSRRASAPESRGPGAANPARSSAFPTRTRQASPGPGSIGHGAGARGGRRPRSARRSRGARDGARRRPLGGLPHDPAPAQPYAPWTSPPASTPFRQSTQPPRSPPRALGSQRGPAQPLVELTDPWLGPGGRPVDPGRGVDSADRSAVRGVGAARPTEAPGAGGPGRVERGPRPFTRAPRRPPCLSSPLGLVDRVTPTGGRGEAAVPGWGWGDRRPSQAAERAPPPSSAAGPDRPPGRPPGGGAGRRSPRRRAHRPRAKVRPVARHPSREAPRSPGPRPVGLPGPLRGSDEADAPTDPRRLGHWGEVGGADQGIGWPRRGQERDRGGAGRWIRWARRPSRFAWSGPVTRVSRKRPGPEGGATPLPRPASPLPRPAAGAAGVEPAAPGPGRPPGRGAEQGERISRCAAGVATQRNPRAPLAASPGRRDGCHRATSRAPLRPRPRGRTPEGAGPTPGATPRGRLHRVSPGRGRLHRTPADPRWAKGRERPTPGGGVTTQRTGQHPVAPPRPDPPSPGDGADERGEPWGTGSGNSGDCTVLADPRRPSRPPRHLPGQAPRGPLRVGPGRGLPPRGPVARPPGQRTPGALVNLAQGRQGSGHPPARSGR